MYLINLNRICIVLLFDSKNCLQKINNYKKVVHFSKGLTVTSKNSPSIFIKLVLFGENII